MASGRPPVCGEYDTLEDFFRATAVAYENAGDHDTATGLLDMARDMRELDRLVDVGAQFEARMPGLIQRADETWEDWLFKVAVADDEAERASYAAFVKVRDALDPGEGVEPVEAEEVVGLAQRAVLYQGALSVILGLGVREMQTLTPEEINKRAARIGELYAVAKRVQEAP